MTTNLVVIAGLACHFLFATAPASAQPAETAADHSTDDLRPPAPQRFHRFVLDAAGPVALLENAAWAGLAQTGDFPAEWGSGAAGYGKRFVSVLAQGVVQESVTYGLSEALAADSRFHKSRKHGFWPRAGDAVSQAFVTRTSEGHSRLSLPLMGGYAAGGMSLIAWYPARYTYKDGLGFAGAALTSRAVVNLLRECVGR
jgi:hypothetical protein